MKLNSTEALFGFCAWLTTRKEQTKMSSSDTCGNIANLIIEFCHTNNMPEVSEDWPENLIYPDGTWKPYKK